MKVKELKSISSVLYSLLVTAVLLSSCISDDFEYGGKTSQGNEVKVKFSLQMPAKSRPGTYAITEIDENEVATIDVLVFKPVDVDAAHTSGYAFAYSRKATGAEITNKFGYTKNEMKEFTVSLIKSEETQDFVILANARAQVEALGDIAVGADKLVLFQRLTFLNNGKWNANNDKADNAPGKSFVPFPMWGEVHEDVGDTTTTEITAGHVLRSIARLDVVLGAQVLADNNFLLDEIYIYNSKKKGFIIPNPYTMDEDKATAASVPASGYAAWNNSTPLIYTVPASMRTAFERTVYLPEAQAVAQDESSKATCIVIGGTFGTNTHTTYYRVDFFKADGKTYRDILRNHKYRANIIKVEGPGHKTPEDAFNSKSINMKFEVKEWDDGGMGNVVFDGQYALSVTPVEFNFPSDAFNEPEDANAFSIFTDFPTGWTIPAANIVDATTGTPITWVKVMKGAAPGTVTTGGIANMKSNLWLKVDENTTGAIRSAKIIVAAGRLRYPVTVNQSITPKKNAIFSFIKYINVSGTDNIVPNAGGQIKAMVNTNMGWKLKTSINGVEAAMSEPAGVVANDYDLSINIPAVPDEWTSATTKVWIEYAGLKLQEGTYSQVGYIIDIIGAPTTINKFGQDVTLNLAGYFPVMKFRVVNAADASKVVSNVVACTAAGDKTIYGSRNVTLSIYPNSSGSSRNVKFQYEKFVGVWVDIATASQPWSGLILPTSGTIAPPGVIGIGATTGRLTLDGSKEYPDGTAKETVYCVFFKWGSTVAINGYAGNYTPSMVAWVPPGFTGDVSSWGNIPYGSLEMTFPAQNNAAGLGDPCKLALRNGAIGNYRMPTNGTAQEQWFDGGWVSIYMGVSGRWSNYGSSKSQFYPAAGYRNNGSGLFNFGSSDGNYWSSAPFNEAAGRALSFDSGGSIPNNAFNRAYGFTVRCVQ